MVTLDKILLMFNIKKTQMITFLKTLLDLFEGTWNLSV